MRDALVDHDVQIAERREYVTPKGLLLVGLLIFSLLCGSALAFSPDIGASVAIGVVTFAAIIVVMLYRPFWGLLIYSVFIFIRPQEFIPALAMPIEKPIALVLLISVLLMLKLKKGMRIRLAGVDYGLLLFVGVASLSILTSIWLIQSWMTWQKLFRLLIIYFLITQTIETRKQLRIFILFIIVSAAFHASGSIINYYKGITQFSMGIDRAIGLGGIESSYGQPNALAATMVLVLPYIFYMFLGDKSMLIRALTVIIILILLWNIILTGSRGGMLGAAFFAIVAMWTSKRRIVYMILVGLVFFSAWDLMPGQYRKRLETSTDFSSNTGEAASARGRIEGLIHGIIMMTDRPLLGYGIGNFATASYLVYETGWAEAHNLLGQVLGELGLLGLIAFIVWMIALFKGLRRIRVYFRQSGDNFLYYTALGLFIQLLVLFFLGIGGHNLYRPNWVIISALTVVIMSLMSGNIMDKANMRIGDSNSNVNFLQ